VYYTATIVDGKEYRVQMNVKFVKKPVKVRVSLAETTGCPITMDELSRDRFKSVRAALMTNTSISAEIISRGIRDADLTVRYRALAHANIADAEIIRALKSKNREVREAILCNSNISIHHLKMAARDKSLSIKRKVACHPLATTEILLLILKSNPKKMEYFVLNNSAATEDVFIEAFDILGDACAGSIIWHKNVTAKVLRKIWERGNERYKSHVIAQPNVDKDILMDACDDIDFHDRIRDHPLLFEDFEFCMKVRMKMLFREWMDLCKDDPLKQIVAQVKYDAMVQSMNVK
jgi:hypothetical protein